MRSERAGHFLIATGVSEYEAPDFDTLPKVKRDVASMVRLFTGSFGYSRVMTKVGLNPRAADFRAALRTWLSEKNRKANDVVVLYFAGHGYVSDSLNHYLCFHDFTTQWPSDTGLRASDIASLFFEGEREAPENVWLILDSCYSGAGAGQAQQEAARILEQARPNAYGGFWVMASARSNEGSEDGAFAPLFHRIVRQRLRNPAYAARSADLLRPDGLADALNQGFERRHLAQKALINATAVSRLFPFFPNPERRAGAAGLDLETQRRIWRDKSRGVGPGEPGDFFTGRTTVLGLLEKWLDSPQSDRRMRVVCGAMGSGKSAVLGRLVITRAPDLALDGRKQTLEQIQASVCAGLGVPVDKFEDTFEALDKRQQPFRIVIDSLDESQDAEKIAREVLRRLAAAPMVRLIAGTRNSLLDALGDSVEVLDLDQPPYWQPDDLPAYIGARLAAGNALGSANLIAAVVADAVKPSFLLAGSATRNLLRQDPPVDTRVAGWEKRVRELLPRSEQEAYDADFLRFGDHRQTVRDILRPLTYAKGLGLPWSDVWDAAASEMSGRKYGRSDVEEVQDQAGFYIVEDQEQGGAVYRLFHDSLAGYLRRDADDRTMERRIAEALIRTAPHRDDGAVDWLNETRPYVRSYLALHAAAAGMLGKLVQDPGFVAAADPDVLQQAMRGSGGQVPADIRSIHARVVHHLRKSAPAEALSYLEMAARSYGLVEWAQRIAATALQRAWQVPWMIWRAETPHRVIRVEDGMSSQGRWGLEWRLSSADLSGQPVVISGDMDGSLRIWDAWTTRQISDAVKLYGGRCTVVAPFTADGRQLIFTADDDGGVTAVDAADPKWRVSVDFDETVRDVAVARVGARTICYCALNSSVALWDPIAGQIVGEHLEAPDSTLYAIGLIESAGKMHVAAGNSTGGLCVWTGDGISFGEAMTVGEHEGAIVHIGVAHEGRQPVFVSIDRQAEVRLWTPDGNEIRRFFTGHNVTKDYGWVNAAAMATFGQTEVIAAGDFEGVIRILDTSSGLSVGEPLVGHSEGVVGLTIGRRDGAPYLASASQDGTIRIWEMGAGTSAAPALSDTEIRAVTVHRTAAGEDLVVAGGSRGAISAWKLATGEPAGVFAGRELGSVHNLTGVRIQGEDRLYSASFGHIDVWDFKQREWIFGWQAGKNQIQDLAYLELEGRHLIASACHDQHAAVWDASTGEALYPAIRHPERVFAVWVGRLPHGPLCLLSGCADGKIRVFDLVTGKPIGKPLAGHKGPVVSLEVGEWRGRQVVLSGSWDGTIRTWDPSDGKPLGEPLAAHMGSVNSLALLAGARQPVLVSGGSDGFVHIWGPLGRPVTSIDLDTFVLKVAPAGNMLAAATGKGVLALRLN